MDYLLLVDMSVKRLVKYLGPLHVTALRSGYATLHKWQLREVPL